MSWRLNLSRQGINFDEVKGVIPPLPPTPVLAEGSSSSSAEVINFRHAVDFLVFFNEDLRTGKQKLYKWQAEILRELSKPRTAHDPLDCAIAAVNGSGKDMFIIAPLAVFVGATIEKSKVVITTSSAKQMNNQTRPNIKALCHAVNIYRKEEYFLITNEVIRCPSKQSAIYMYVTDEAGKAEGYHPDFLGGPLYLIVNEAKSISEEIFKSMYRCTGYTHRVDISSPGLAQGHFYRTFTEGRWKTWKIDAFDCPHLGKKFADGVEAMYGRTSPLYKSMVECEFGDDDSQVVIPLLVLEKCRKASPVHREQETDTGGVDLARTNDEICMVIRNGNKVKHILHAHVSNTTFGISIIISWLLKYKPAVVYADAGGLGAPIIDELIKKGFKCFRYVYFNNSPKDPRAFYNKGTEMWFNTSYLMEDDLLIIPKDEKLDFQLTSRTYKFDNDQCARLTDKAKMTFSPDRADAMVLAFSDYSFKEFTSNFTPARKLSKEDYIKMIPAPLTDRAIVGVKKDKHNIQRVTNKTDLYQELDNVRELIRRN